MKIYFSFFVRDMDVLFSIKPNYAAQIFDGIKKYELRKTCCKKPIKRMYIYATAPICAVLGECIIETVLQDSPELLWKIVSPYSGISEKDYFEYFAGAKKAVAYKLIKVIQYQQPKKLDYFHLKTPPQSFCYIRR